MEITYRPIDVWPGQLRTYLQRQGPPFRATWSDTLRLLDRELTNLRAKRIVLQLALTEADLRLDGMPRSSARPEHPGVILAFESMHGPLKYATDVFEGGTVVRDGWQGRSRDHMPGWQANVRAVALGLEALRKVDHEQACLHLGDETEQPNEHEARVLADAAAVQADIAALND